MVRETNPVLVIWELKCTVVRTVEGQRTGSAGNLSWGSFPRLVSQLPLLNGGVGNQPLSGSLQLHRTGVNVCFYAAFFTGILSVLPKLAYTSKAGNKVSFPQLQQ